VCGELVRVLAQVYGCCFDQMLHRFCFVELLKHPCMIILKITVDVRDKDLEMQQYIEILLYCNIFCHNTMQYGYRYIAHCNILLYIAIYC